MIRSRVIPQPEPHPEPGRFRLVSGDNDGPRRSVDAGPLIREHLPAAYNLARWLLGGATDAEDAVQESCVRALRARTGPRAAADRAWFLTIVRNVCFDTLRRGRSVEPESRLLDQAAKEPLPDAAAISRADSAAVRRAVEMLPPRLREVIVLREMEGLGYSQISRVIGSPIGTVMSRLSRARAALAVRLVQEGVS